MAVKTTLVPAGVFPAVRDKAMEVINATGNAVTHTWGISSVPDHNNRRCVDFMVKTIANGDRVAAYLIRNAGRLGVQGIIWNGRVMGFPENGPGYAGPSGVWRPYRGGNPHRDHPHVQFSSAKYIPPAGGGAPAPKPPAVVDYWQKEFGMSKEEVRAMMREELSLALRQGKLGGDHLGGYWPSSFANNVGHAAAHARNLDKGGVAAQTRSAFWEPMIPKAGGVAGSSLINNIHHIEFRTAWLVNAVGTLLDLVKDLAKDDRNASVQVRNLMHELDDAAAPLELRNEVQSFMLAAAVSDVPDEDAVDSDTFTGDDEEGQENA